ncbi:MAG: HD-GYP domain-containing protein, partial [Coriobacteriales bacterium]|nr:HD-GYP domain-containing protein [Coriobacteriales bacterium]
TENKSGQTGQHIKRVSEYTRVLADEMGFAPDEVERIRLASTMHDIGKLLVPSEILDKPGRLTDEEFAIIKKHTTYGGQLLNNVEGDVMRLSRTIALDHHERWDANGYAQGKGADEISLEGRIVAVADVYDALTSRRSYKEAWDDREAYDEIVRCSGSQFDPKVVEAFCARYEEINQIRKDFQD